MTRSGGFERRPAQRIGAGLGVLHGEAVELEAGAQEAADLDLVVDDEDDGSGFSHRVRPRVGWRVVANGRWIETVVPWSAPELAAWILPPLAPTKALAIHRPRPEPEVVGGVARAAEEPLAELRLFLAGEPDAAVVHRQHDVAPVALGRHRDRRAGGRIFGRVVDDLHECLLDQHRIDIDQRQIGVHVERDMVAGTAAAGGARAPN